MTQVVPVPVVGSNRAETIDITKFPSETRDALADFDVNGDGQVSKAELSRAAKLLLNVKEKNYFLRKVIIIFAAIALFILASNYGLTISVVYLTKDSKLESNVFVSASDSKPIAVSSDIVIPMQKESFVPKRRRLRRRLNQPALDIGLLSRSEVEKTHRAMTTKGVGAVQARFSDIYAVASASQGRMLSVGDDVTTSVNLDVALSARIGNNKALLLAPGIFGNATTSQSIALECSDMDCAVSLVGLQFEADNFRKLQLHESRYLQAVQYDDDFICVAYHCFTGDVHCDEPSDNMYCSEWDASGSCERPMCKYIYNARVDIALGEDVNGTGYIRAYTRQLASVLEDAFVGGFVGCTVAAPVGFIAGSITGPGAFVVAGFACMGGFAVGFMSAMIVSICNKASRRQRLR